MPLQGPGALGRDKGGGSQGQEGAGSGRPPQRGKGAWAKDPSPKVRDVGILCPCVPGVRPKQCFTGTGRSQGSQLYNLCF